MFVARRYRLYPTVDQAAHLRSMVGACRVVFNIALEHRQTAYRFTGRSPRVVAQSRDLKELRNDPEIAPWLRDIPAQVLQQALRDVDTAYRRFFRGEAGYPSFKRKTGGGSFRDPQYVRVERVSRRWGQVKLQGVGPVRFRWHRSPVGTVKHATVTLEPDGTWWVSLACAQCTRTPAQRNQPPIGVDLGVAVPVATSEGEHLGFTALRPKELERLLRLERRAARHDKGSRNRARTRQHINVLKARARRRRTDFAHQTSHFLTKNHGTVVFEDLVISAITRSAKGTVDEPGRNVPQKAGLNREILNVGWGAIRSLTEQKAARRGVTVVRVPAAYTSQTCPECGNVRAENRLTRSLYVCRSCGYTGHADTGAAVNILNRALARGLVPGAAGGTPVAARPGYAPGTRHTNGAEPSTGAGRREHQMGHRTVRSAA